SKMRIGEQGRGTKPSPGWRSPALVRGLSRSGKLPVVVHSVTQLARLDAVKNAAIIGGTVGARKRATLLAAAEKAKLEVLNAR
ncbi:MAG TPA: eL32 family ribosomal protein, partial [archaeon]|nr:eL32 family ribosomal protein [archaeon]